MPRPDDLPLTDLQLALLRVLWARGEATVVDVHEALARDGKDLAPQTVATVLKRLENRGVVAHRIEGRKHVFRALVDEDETTREQLDEVAERLFAGDVSELVTTLLEEREIAAGDLARLRRLIEAKERELGAEKNTGEKSDA